MNKTKVKPDTANNSINLCTYITVIIYVLSSLEDNKTEYYYLFMQSKAKLSIALMHYTDTVNQILHVLTFEWWGSLRQGTLGCWVDGHCWVLADQGRPIASCSGALK